MTIKIALSYSHQDEPLRDELETHLSALKRQGLIDTWHDRKIIEGREFAGEIDRNFEEAQAILLLVSPDFIASDYCYNIEMTRAIERHHAGTAKVVPVILRRCHWTDLPFGKLLATPPDGKAVTEFASHDAGFYEVVSAVKRALKDVGRAPAPRQPPAAAAAPAAAPAAVASTAAERSSNLRMKRTFTDQDRDRAITQCFDFLVNFFENSLEEMRTRHPGTDFEFRKIDANSFSAVIYSDGKKVASCGIWFDAGRDANIYCSQNGVSRGSYNESMSVKEDGYQIGFEAMGMAMHARQGHDRQGILSFQGVGEYFWDMLIQPLQ